MNTKDFVLTFREFLGRSGWSTGLSPWALVEQWQQLVEECAVCYESDYYDFDSELAVRDILQRSFEDERLQGYPQMESLRERVDAIDGQFKALILDGVAIRPKSDRWWRRAVLKRAGAEYRDDMKRLHNVAIEPC